MLHFNGYVAGWLNSTISDFLGELSSDVGPAKHALITCLDSNPCPALLLTDNADLRAAMDGATTLDKCLLVPLKRLREAALRDQLFYGFDEIWFFSTDAIKPKPPTASIVGPNRIDREAIEELGQWMVANDCLLGLGDGAGLNIIAKAEGLAKSIIGHSLTQSEPALQMSDLWVQDEGMAIEGTRPDKRQTVKKVEQRHT